MLGKMGMPVFVTTRKCHKELVRHIVKDVYSYYVPDKYDDSNSNKSNLEKNGRSHDYKGDHIAGWKLRMLCKLHVLLHVLLKNKTNAL